MPAFEAPCTELESAPRTPIVVPSPSPSPSEVSNTSTSSPEPQSIRPSSLFRILAMPPPDPVQPSGQEELERRLPGYRRIIIPRELTLIELLKQCSGVTTDDEVLYIREAKLRVVAERVGLRRLHVLAPCLRSLTLDGSVIQSLRDLGIGLVHLKILSVNRCGLTSLDGIWGLSSLRELHAARNQLEDLQPLAALQKMHTLNIAHNPISDASRLWMLAVCGSLRNLTLEGTPASDEEDYRATVASALPMLVSLDGLPLHTDIEDDFYGLENDSSSSESEADGVSKDQKPLEEPKPSTSKETQKGEDLGENLETMVRGTTLPKIQRRRPATTENAGVRPRVALQPRPKTAHERPTIDAPTRLVILNTLMDEEWRSSGSKLTSRGAVCGNLAHALRRPMTARKASERAARDALIESGIDIVSREIAEEIPRAPGLGDWEKFKMETGIDIDFSQCRASEGDAAQAIDRLERIERETAERMSSPNKIRENFDMKDRFNFTPAAQELWKMENPLLMDTLDAEFRPTGEFMGGVSDLFANIGLVRTPDGSIPDRTPGESLPNSTPEESLPNSTPEESLPNCTPRESLPDCNPDESLPD
ncbi:hypothetical protein O0L34_g8671 [Tuta absoluta]|nr:hypothetical protein O0L34_g8671 [Tuta absoluta]